MHTIHTALPCRIIDDFGGAFAMGAIGGSVWHGVKGYRNSPSGMKMRSSIGAIKARAPVLGGMRLRDLDNIPFACQQCMYFH